ncbi:multiple sugar transport system substrate-binding protein [Haloactinopolyspora alba]|uniref:Multiple sugar transport system substrate-binding protein n=1 Tax=Haloactinopolyspora alba TaxID=648780 RepID=A0A2P8E721_9ACTN|nr:extracellular solute-binding protein [Haloactinopolyspora alba]PSL05262.1 multiple sugar transport system substrate-binding protein [Haloactinopolyspora alba]
MAPTLTRRSFLSSTAKTGISFTALSAYLAACSSGTGAGTAAGDGSSAAPITAVLPEAPWLDSFRQVVSVYEDETGNTVDVRVFPFDAVPTQAFNAVSQRSKEFDIFTLAEGFVGQFYSSEVLAPMTEIDPSFTWPEGVITYDNLGRWDRERGWFDPEGTIYGLPVNGNIQLFLYRRDLYDEFGLEVPETWEDVLNIAKEHDSDQLQGYVMRPRLFDFMAILHGYGGDLFANPPDDYTVTIDDAAGQAALETTIQLVSHGPRDPQTIEQPELTALFQTGEVLQGHAVSATHALLDDPARSKVAGKIDYAVVPRPADGEHASMTGALVQAIPAHLADEQKEAALAFLRWLMTKDAQMRYAEAGGVVTHQEVYESDLADESEYRYMKAVSDSTEYLHGFARYTFGAKIREALDRRFQELFTGSLGVDDGLTKMRTDLEEIVKAEGVAS